MFDLCKFVSEITITSISTLTASNSFFFFLNELRNPASPVGRLQVIIWFSPFKSQLSSPSYIHLQGKKNLFIALDKLEVTTIYLSNTFYIHVHTIMMKTERQNIWQETKRKRKNSSVVIDCEHSSSVGSIVIQCTWNINSKWRLKRTSAA